jgi:hypothetical protein
VRLAHEHWRAPAVAVVLRDLLAHPSAWLLDSLTIGPAARGRGDSRTGVGAVLEAYGPPLRELVLAPGRGRGERVDLAELLARLPELRRLEIRGGSIQCDAPIVHDRLETLLLTLDSRFEGMPALARGSLPRLERLEISAPGLIAGRPGVLGILETSCPRLRAIALERTRFAELIAEALLIAPALSRLDEVVLRGMVSAQAAKALAGYAADPRFAHLRIREIGA